MLTEQQIADHLRRLSYKPGWTFRVKRHPHEGLQIRIVAEGLPDSYHPGETIDIGVDPFVPPMVDTFYVERFMKYRLERIEITRASNGSSVMADLFGIRTPPRST